MNKIWTNQFTEQKRRRVPCAIYSICEMKQNFFTVVSYFLSVEDHFYRECRLGRRCIFPSLFIDIMFPSVIHQRHHLAAIGFVASQIYSAFLQALRGEIWFCLLNSDPMKAKCNIIYRSSLRRLHNPDLIPEKKLRKTIHSIFKRETKVLQNLPNKWCSSVQERLTSFLSLNWAIRWNCTIGG